MTERGSDRQRSTDEHLAVSLHRRPHLVDKASELRFAEIERRRKQRLLQVLIGIPQPRAEPHGSGGDLSGCQRDQTGDNG